jgi:hypothetical protein
MQEELLSRFSSHKSGQRTQVSWPTSNSFLPRRLRYGGVIHKVRIYCRGPRIGTPGHCHIAMAKVKGVLLEGAPAATPEKALACLLKLIDPEIEIVRDSNGIILA